MDYLKDYLRYRKALAINKKAIEALLKRPASQKRDALIWMLEGKPLSMAVAFTELGIGSYRDVIYELRKDGNDIRDFYCHKKGFRGVPIMWKVHYLACFPESIIKHKTKN